MTPAPLGYKEYGVKRILPLLLLTLAALVVLVGVGAGSTGSRSGLRGTVLLEPGSPTCKPGTSCGRPAAHALLRFWRNGQLVAQTRTDSQGRFRIALRPRTYRVTSMKGATLNPTRVTVATNGFRRVTIRIDTGIR